QRISLVRGLIDICRPDQHSGRIDRVENVGVIELNIRIDLEQGLPGTGPRHDIKANEGKSADHRIRGVPGGSVESSELSETGVSNCCSGMSGLIGIDCNNTAVASEKLVPCEASRCRLDRRSVVLGAAEGDFAQRVEGYGMEF